MFDYKNDVLHCEDVDLAALATQYGTPAYVYSGTMIRQRFHEYEDALAGVSHQICYAVKANSNLAILSLLAREGAGFDIVSGGELFRVIQAGGDPTKTVFSGVGKTDDEIRYALSQKIHSFNCESEFEIETISRIATELGLTARIALRVNPDVDAETHPYISTGMSDHKFGIAIEIAEEIYHKAAKLPGLKVEGVSCHIGSQLLSAEPFLDAADKVLALVARLRTAGLAISTLDLGGGLGVAYHNDETPIPIAVLMEKLCAKIEGLDLTLMLEPGRSIVAEAGVLLSRVILVKQNGEKTFIIVDAGMNDLIRPSLYEAYHEIDPVQRSNAKRITADVVGPVCETGDFLALDRDMPEVKSGDLIAIKTAGAYGMAMASNYNSRGRPVELLIEDDRVHVARARETWEDLVRGESTI
jgi:diaminopimelate decarboxylase